MHGARGHARSNKTYGQNLLLTVAHQENDMPYACRPSSHPFAQKKNSSSAESSSNSRESWHNREPRSRPRGYDDESLFSVNLPPTQPIRRAPRAISTTGPTGRRKFIYRSFQVLSLLIIAVSLYALVENIKYLVQTYENEEYTLEVNKPFVNINEELKSWVIHEKYQSSPEPPAVGNSFIDNSKQEFLRRTTENSVNSDIVQKYVLNINSLSIGLNNKSICQSNSKSKSSLGEGIYFMIIVHSAPEHFEARQAIRSTWGSVKSLKNYAIRLVFILGKSGDWIEDSDLVESSITRESEIFGDIVTGTFVDSYRNLTYKHLLGYKWAMEYCPSASFILKTDDDAFLDIFQLFDFISRTYGFKPAQGTLVCNVFPEGTKPVRNSDTKGTKWAVTSDEYPHIIYPKYCGGLAYLVTPDVVRRILDVSDKVRFFWIDDVFVTGVLRELTGVEPFYLNLRYSYEPERYRNWLTSAPTISTKTHNGHGNNTNVINVSSKLLKFPFIIAHVERGPKFSEEMNHLWRKTLRVWSSEHALGR